MTTATGKSENINKCLSDNDVAANLAHQDSNGHVEFKMSSERLVRERGRDGGVTAEGAADLNHWHAAQRIHATSDWHSHAVPRRQVSVYKLPLG